MKTRITTAIIFGIIMGLFIIPGFWSIHFSVPLLIVIAVLAPAEFSDALSKVGVKLNTKLLMLFNLAFTGGLIYILITKIELISVKKLVMDSSNSFISSVNTELSSKLFILYGVIIAVLGLISIAVPLLKQGPSGLKTGIYNISAGLYVSFPLFCGFLLLYTIPIGWFLFVLAIITPWVCDSAALFSGMLWGKKKMAPKISPNKTMAGFYGGIVGTVVLYLLLYFLLIPKLFVFETSVTGSISVIFIAVVIAILTQFGDLLASSIKRTCGIKDFSNLMPGHGGIMDRFDSTFFTFTAILTIALLVHFF